MPELQSSPGDTYGSHAVRLDPGQGLRDIGFVIGLKAVHRIELRLAASADTRPFLQCPWITDARLTLESWDIDLSGFRHCESLQVRCDDAQGTHAWAYDFPTLKSLEVMGGQHRFDAMQAPLLEDLRLSRVSVASMRGLSGCRDLNLSGSTLGCLEGLGPVRALCLWDTTIGDFRGIESAELTMLDLSRGTYAGLAPITRIRSLQTLKFNEASSSASALQLPPCPQIRSLEIPGFSGSLSFLAGWTALEELDLRNSGKLTDIDALTGLTTLKKIRIRGATVKRDAWPAQLKDSLDTR